MVNIPLITTAVKAFAAVWSLLLFILSAAMIGQFNSDSWYRGSGFREGNAVLAASIFCMLYFAAAVAFLFLRPTSIFISVLVDVAVLGFLFIFLIASVGAMSEGASLFRQCGRSWCNLGTGVLAIGWILVFIILGLIILEVVVTLRGYGGGLETWKTPFNELITNGSASYGHGHSSRSGGGVEHKAESGTAGPSVVQQQQPAVVQTA